MSTSKISDFQKVLHERYEVKRDIRLMMWAIEEIEDSVAGTPAKPGIYSIINNKVKCLIKIKILRFYCKVMVAL
jgi:hypothetical protein